MGQARAEEVRAQIAAARLAERHDFVDVDLGAAEGALENSPVPLDSMGRNYRDDPDFFRAAGAAGVRAAQVARP
jgi:hypothetical protein